MTAGALPSGVVTFLFTDVEGSTRRWEADADSMRAALATHDEILRRSVASHGGVLVKHTGDGIVAAFRSPMSAVDAAVAAQRKVNLPVRMGLATGEAELRDGDYFGAVLNRAARVMSAGHGGQILLADSTAALLNNVDLVALGSRRLRDVPMPVEVFQVRAAGLRAEFPPLRASDVTPGNLRPATTDLIGRDGETAALHAAVQAQRLVTLTGVGGVGKTRLATEVAARMADEFPDGVWFFDLAAVSDPAAIPDAVATVLGITQQAGKSVSDSVITALEGRVRLLVFDNCEHVLDAAADMIDAILAACPTVKVLATSREGLRLADEQLWPVSSLNDAAAVDLFVERARRVAPAFVGDDTKAIAEICRRLDGIPLAIELAASRTASMTVREVYDHLDHRFRLLVGSRRSTERHQTLRHAVAWSYDHLDDLEKTLLQRCSVFAGGFDAKGACAVAGLDEADELVILDVLDSLVRKSLLVADRSSTRTRFSLLETIRQFADEHLAGSGASEQARNAHAAYYAERESDLMAIWDSVRQREAYEWFAAEIANLRSAFRFAADRHELDIAAQIACYAAFFGFLTENYEPIAWAEELIEAARAARHPRLGALYVAASNCYMAGRIEAGVAYTEVAERALRDGRTVIASGAEGFVGAAYVSIGEPERWVQCSRAQLARDSTNALTRVSLLNALGVIGAVEEAKAAADGLVEAAEAADNPFTLSLALGAFGFVFYDDDPDGALLALRRGMEIAQDSSNRFSLSLLAYNLGRAEAEHGNPLVALDRFRLAISNFHDAGNSYMIRTPLGFLAAFFDRLGRYEPAAVISGFAGSSPLAALPVMAEFERSTAHLSDELGATMYAALTGRGAAMTMAEVVTYAYDQIDQARAVVQTS